MASPTSPAAPGKGLIPPTANSQPPFPSPSGGRWHPPIPREADDGRGRTRPLADGKIVDLLPRLRSFLRRGPATFSLSRRPCGRHPPPLGEGTGEGVASPPENRNGQDPVPQALAQRPCLGEESCLFLFGLPVSPYTGASPFSGWRKTPPCPDTPARRRARPRCAGAGCTWPPGRCGWERRS